MDNILRRNTKYLFFSYLLLMSIKTEAQLYNRETNNNLVYNDSTAKVEIFSIYSLIKKGEKFEEVAIKYSQDPGSYKLGGLLNPSTMEEYVPEYKAVTLKLAISELSMPFKTDFGYHIVQLISKKDKVYTTRHILLRID